MPPPQQICRSCSAPIFWAFTAAGKRIPIDYEPVAGGNIWISPGDHGPIANVVKVEMFDKPADDTRYVSHFATCVDAAKHRKAK